MKSFELKKNSWHYRLANTYGPLTPYRAESGVSFCEYFWSVVIGFIPASLGSLFVGALLGMMVGQAAAAIMLLSQGYGRSAILFDEPGPIFLMFFLAVGLIIYLVFFTNLPTAINAALEDKSDNDEEVKPGFIVLAYRKIKDKTCVTVVLK